MDWVKELNFSLPAFLSMLQVNEQTGRYLPCSKGNTRLGKQVALGFSCFALKMMKILNLWKDLPVNNQTDWIDFIRSFQVRGNPSRNPYMENAFIDPAVIYLSHHYWVYPNQFLYHLNSVRLNPRQFYRQYLHWHTLKSIDRALIAETKQAIATLAEVGARSNFVYSSLPNTPESLLNHLKNLDWRQPWGAGGQAATLPVIIKTQYSRFMAEPEIQALTQSCGNFFLSIANNRTGAFFHGAVPSYGNLINGAMKVLTALDWLDYPIPYPKQLIDTCLSKFPTSDGCHLVDNIYVLYRCILQVEHRRFEIQAYCLQVLDMIKEHYNRDGGFSYYIGRSQTGYYGVHITRGLPESDLHGTLLLTWALMMILEILDENIFGWQMIKP